MAIATVAKNSAAAKGFRKLRSRIGKPTEGDDPLVPVPVRAPTP